MQQFYTSVCNLDPKSYCTQQEIDSLDEYRMVANIGIYNNPPLHDQ